MKLAEKMRARYECAQAEDAVWRSAYAAAYRKTYRRTLEKLRADGWPLLDAVRMAECNAHHEAMEACQDAGSACRMLAVANNMKGA